MREAVTALPDKLDAVLEADGSLSKGQVYIILRRFTSQWWMLRLCLTATIALSRSSLVTQTQDCYS